MAKKYIVDRLEEDAALLQEIETMENYMFKIKDLPEKTKEGDCLVELTEGIFFIDENETEKRKKLIENMLDDLFEN